MTSTLHARIWLSHKKKRKEDFFMNISVRTAQPATYFCQIYLNIRLVFTLRASKFDG